MSEVSSFLSDAEKKSLKASMEQYAESMQGVTPLPRLKHTHTVSLAFFDEPEHPKLTSDDLDTAIQIANGVEDDFYNPIVRGRTIELKDSSLHTTSADPIQEFFIHSALRYLATRPVAPLE